MDGIATSAYTLVCYQDAFDLESHIVIILCMDMIYDHT